MEGYRLQIQGSVQGVSFRYSAKEQANRLGITGWIRNEEDGTVTLEAYGAPKNCVQFLAWCNTGPETARVETVDVSKIPHQIYNQFFIH